MFWRGVWGYLPANIVQGVVGLLTILIFTRLLSAEDFGRYALAFSVMSLAHVAAFTWLEAAMARFWAAQKPDEMSSHFASVWRTLAIIILAFAPIAALALWMWPVEAPLKLAVAAGLAGVPVRCAAKIAQERFRAAGEVGPAARLDIWTTAGGFAIGVAFALAGAGGAAPLLGLALAPLAALPFILPGEIKQTRDGQVEPGRLRSYAAYGFPLSASLALALALASTDRFLLAAFLDEATVGAYHAAYSLANRTLDVIFIWLGAAGGPALIMALERGGQGALRAAAREQASVFVLIALPAAVGLALVAQPMAEVMIGEDLRTAAASVTPWIAAGAFLAGMTTYYFHQAFTLGRRTGWLLAAMAIPALANLILCLILIPIMGLTGAAAATALSFGVAVFASIALGGRVQPLPFPAEALLRCGAAALLMAAVVSVLPDLGGLAELILKAGAGAATYAVATLMLNAAGVRDHGARLLRHPRLSFLRAAP
ncbi:lipopolysaccharide biosynthesis protein [Brevundimonas sp. 2R-24]|uniref:Lipopolysaccharide biosynthesis protein n=1 Tax=Peiella sedimenti TaxID=3061083 RepID=A0ABT8SP43_9CAUL|nr:lipopolysaccharide biosynthesis protein [Caulobacteraceae bacterium XZ-24]